MNGGQQLTAQCFAAWLCLGQPALFFALGVFFGRHGWRRGIYRIYLALGGGQVHRGTNY